MAAVAAATTASAVALDRVLDKGLSFDDEAARSGAEGIPDPAHGGQDKPKRIPGEGCGASAAERAGEDETGVTRTGEPQGG
jgi:hypothetical protein